MTLFQRHMAIEDMIAGLYEDALSIAKACQDYEEQCAAYAQVAKYHDALRAFQDFLIDADSVRQFAEASKHC